MRSIKPFQCCQPKDKGMPGKRILTVVLIAMAMMLGSPTNQIKYMKLFPNETRLSQSPSGSFIYW